MENNNLIELKATNGILFVYEDRVVISRKTFTGFMMQGHAGDRTIYFSDIQSVEFRKPTLIANGYLQFIVAGTSYTNSRPGLLGSSKQSTEDPNTLLLRAFNKKTPIEAEKAHKVILDRLNHYRNGKNQNSGLSSADELRKYKSLLDDGIISQEEYDLKKKVLLG